MHVDKEFPGDRLSDCKNLMKPVGLKKTKKGWQIIHKCTKCDTENVNITAEDDNFEKITELSRIPTE